MTAKKPQATKTTKPVPLSKRFAIRATKLTLGAAVLSGRAAKRISRNVLEGVTEATAELRD